MATTVRPSTVSASSNVCTPRLATLSSTAATPCGRSVTDSSRFILIMPLLLSAPDQQPLPSLALSRACSPDQPCVHQLQPGGTDQTPRPEYQNVRRGSRVDQATSSHRRRAISSESRLRFPVRSHDKNRKSSSLRARVFLKQSR